MITKNFIPAISFATAAYAGTAELNRIDSALDNIIVGSNQNQLTDFYTGIYEKKTSYNGQLDNTGQGLFVFVGNGTTPATKDDINLESHIPYSDTGLCVTASNVSYIRSQDTFLIFIVTLENKSDAPITITENGLFFRPGDAWPHYPYNYMLARETFDPVTIESGQIKTITMTIKI